MSASKCVAAVVMASMALAAFAAASPADVELDKVDDILVVRVTEAEQQQQQRERQERRLDSASAAVGNGPVTIDFFEEKDARNGAEIVEEIQVQGRCLSEALSELQLRKVISKYNAKVYAQFTSVLFALFREVVDADQAVQPNETSHRSCPRVTASSRTATTTGPSSCPSCGPTTRGRKSRLRKRDEFLCDFFVIVTSSPPLFYKTFAQ